MRVELRLDLSRLRVDPRAAAPTTYPIATTPHVPQQGSGLERLLGHHVAGRPPLGRTNGVLAPEVATGGATATV